MELKGKVALVTGSTSGIGKGIAEALAKAGAHIAINGFGDQSEIDAQRKELESQYGVSTYYHGADLTKQDEIEALIQGVQESLGSVDILVNNAGVQHVSPVESFPIEKWDLIIALNLSAAFHTTRLCVEGMKQKGWGRIINLASAHALVASPYKSAYVAAKHGIAGLTKVVALESAKEGVTCNAICPGYVLTPLVEGQISDTAKARGISEQEVKEDVLLAAQPTKEFTTVEQIGALTVTLCQDASANLTGAIIPVDGGWTAQ